VLEGWLVGGEDASSIVGNGPFFQAARNDYGHFRSPAEEPPQLRDFLCRARWSGWIQKRMRMAPGR